MKKIISSCFLIFLLGCEVPELDKTPATLNLGKSNNNSQKEEEHFCKQVAQRRAMRKEFDKSLGKVRYVHVEREKVSQMVIYTRRNIIYFTMEAEMAISTKIRLITRIKKITSEL